jgi:SAM-dependent methyltransferase
MIERYKSNATSFGLSQDKINAVVGNLLSDSPEPSSLASGEYRDFDLITVGSALHHFGSTEEAMKQLAKRLKPGGALFVQDLYPDQDRDGSDSAKTRPRGYTEADMQKLMEEAGLEGFKFEVLPGDIEVELPNEEMIMIRCFIARATKPLA